MKFSESLQRKLICPATKAKLRQNGEYLESIADSRIRYPIIDGIPVLIDTGKSLFAIEDFLSYRNTTLELQEHPFKKFFKRFFPGISVNIKAKDNYRTLVSLLTERATIFVIGGSFPGEGIETLYANDSFEIISSDVSYGPYTTLISDAHDIPFEDQTFDGVVIQAVLEHVLDPHRCVHEIHRVLKPDGLVYAEIPFMQQVHGRPYDFTRFTHLGQRWLFRDFEEIISGPCCGPGMALAWSYKYFLRSFVSSQTRIQLVSALVYLTSFFLKYFDYYLIKNPGSYDAASAYYFLGRKSQTSLSAKELISQYKGTRPKL